MRKIKEENCIIIAGELYSSKNSKRIFVNKASGKPFITKSQVSKDQEADFYTQLWQQKTLFTKMLSESGCPAFPLKLEFEIFRSRKGRFDYINIIQGLCDALVTAGFIPDDSADYLIPVFKPYQLDKTNPRTIIKIIN